jgi:hypothetical protein
LRKRRDMASAIEDVSSLPGETVRDQEGRKLGEVQEIYAVGEGTPMWVTVETSTGIGRTRLVFIPIARLKQEDDEIRTPYSFQHLHDSPQVEGDELSEEDDRTLRAYYGIGLGDTEMVEGAQSYASQVPDEDEPARKIEASEAEGMVRALDDRPPGERAAEADEARQREQDERDEHAESDEPADEAEDD